MGERKGKTSRRDPAHPAGRPAVAKVKRTIGLTPEASRRLDVHAVGTGRDVGEIVEDLVNTYLRRFVLTDRGGRAPGAEPEGEGASQAAEAGGVGGS